MHPIRQRDNQRETLLQVACGATTFRSGDEVNTIAYWECPNCHALAKLTFPSTYSISRMCPCYSLVPAQGCVEWRTTYRMQPLNDAAKQIDAWEEARDLQQRHIYEKHQEMLKDWPP
jgi:hypothetical protein